MKRAADHPLEFYPGFALTYGQINGLGDDFYAASKPICLGKDANEQRQLFQAAFSGLAKRSSRQPKEAKDILAALKDEVDVVGEAIKKGQDPSEVYGKVKDQNLKFWWLT